MRCYWEQVGKHIENLRIILGTQWEPQKKAIGLLDASTIPHSVSKIYILNCVQLPYLTY
jgi:hypothetical protein